MDRVLLYKDWLDSFRQEVEGELERMRKAPVTAPAPKVKPVEEASEGMRSWWERTFDDPVGPGRELEALQGNKEFEMSRREVAALQEELERLRGDKGETFPNLHEKIRGLVGQKATLEEQLSLAIKEIAGLKEYRELKKEMDQELGGLRVRMGALRGEYEARIKLLQEQVEGHERRGAAFQAELGNERDRRLQAEKTADEHRSRMAEADALRAELRGVRGEVEAKLSSAAEFLEAKIRGVQDQSKGQASQLRELVEALRRLRDG